MHFSASSQWSKICFGYQGIIFNWKKVLKFSQIVSVKLEGGDPPIPPKAVSLTAFSQVFFTPSLIIFANTTVISIVKTNIISISDTIVISKGG